MHEPKILIVDDDPTLSTLVYHVLTENGFAALEENRSAAALATARDYLPDAVVLDINMPGKHGGQVAVELRNDPVLKDVPIMFLTSLVSSPDGIFRNNTLYCAKPVEPGKLVESVRKLLGKVTLAQTQEPSPNAKQVTLELTSDVSAEETVTLG